MGCVMTKEKGVIMRVVGANSGTERQQAQEALPKKIRRSRRDMERKRNLSRVGLLPC